MLMYLAGEREVIKKHTRQSTQVCFDMREARFIANISIVVSFLSFVGLCCLVQQIQKQQQQHSCCCVILFAPLFWLSFQTNIEFFQADVFFLGRSIYSAFYSAYSQQFVCVSFLFAIVLSKSHSIQNDCWQQLLCEPLQNNHSILCQAAFISTLHFEFEMKSPKLYRAHANAHATLNSATA